MARRISRKQLKQDEVYDAAVDAGHWLEEHWADVLKWVAGAVLVVVVVLGWMAFTRNKREAAAARLADGIHVYDQAEAASFADRAQLDQALASFDQVAADNGGATGDLARFYAGAALYRMGRMDEAISRLEPLTGGGESGTLIVTAESLLARVYAAAGRRDEAAALLEGLASRTASPLPPAQALLQLAQLEREAGRLDDARRVWQRIVDEYPDSLAAQQARELLES